MPDDLSHIGAQGRARMVDVSGKDVTAREARARGRIVMQPDTLARIRTGGIAKGDVLAVAQVAGIMAAKKTADLIPMCHPLPLDAVDISFAFLDAESSLQIEAVAKTTGKTGVEMEAMAAAAAAALTVYDMCKAIDRGMVIADIKLISKSGGKSGSFTRPG